MTSRSSHPLVLEYKKRRFDGGPEVEMIEQIELQYRIYEQQRLQGAWQQAQQQQQQQPQHPINPMAYAPVAQHPQQAGAPQHEASSVPPPPPPPPCPKLTAKEKLYSAFVMPYVELILGLSGVLIGGIMFVTLMKGAALNPEILAQERKALIQQSWLVVSTSLKGIMLSPWRATRLLMQR